MKAKANVKLTAGCFEIGYAAGVVWGIFSRILASPPLEFVLTSANDSSHSTNSLHYHGRAIDVRSKTTIPPPIRAMVFNKIKTELEAQGFDCVDEGDHFHIEFDPKSGERFITVVD